MRKSVRREKDSTRTARGVQVVHREHGLLLGLNDDPKPVGLLGHHVPLTIIVGDLEADL
jgi:hypothetical protein